MHTFTLRLSTSLHRGVKQLAEREGVSMNQLIATSVAEELSTLSTRDVKILLAYFLPQRAAAVDSCYRTQRRRA